MACGALMRSCCCNHVTHRGHFAGSNINPFVIHNLFVWLRLSTFLYLLCKPHRHAVPPIPIFLIGSFLRLSIIRHPKVTHICTERFTSAVIEIDWWGVIHPPASIHSTTHSLRERCSILYRTFKSTASGSWFNLHRNMIN